MTRARRRRLAEPRDVATYDGTPLVGRVVFVGDEWRAEDSSGRSLGLFATRSDARDALAEDRRATR